jgi:glycerol-3-phosphate dehydrogenase
MYDVIIIGCGVNGALIARELSRYDLKVLILEKNNDVGDATSCANSGIIHSGYDPKPDTLKAKLNILGNAMYDDICKDLDVEFERIGSLTIATSAEEVEKLEMLEQRAKENKVNVQILSKDEVIKLEPNITKDVVKALLAPTAGIINPFELVIAAAENAIDNGVKLSLNEEVIAIDKVNGNYLVKTNKGQYYAKVVVNAAGVHADIVNNYINEEKYELTPRKGEYFVLDHFEPQYVKHILFTLPTKKGKGVLVTPTTSKNYLIGPSSEFVIDKDDVSTTKDDLDSVLDKAFKMVEFIPKNRIIREFAGLRAYHASDDFIINDKYGFINVLGIQSPGLTAAPAIALEVINLIKPYFEFKEKKNFNPKRRPLYRLNTLDSNKRNEIISKDKSFGNIICRCEQVSEGEIVDAIRRNCGARTIKGVKKRVRPGAGKCQGGFCEPLVMRILARELNVDMKDIMLDNEGAYILLEKTKVGDNND